MPSSALSRVPVHDPLRWAQGPGSFRWHPNQGSGEAPEGQGVPKISGDVGSLSARLGVKRPPFLLPCLSPLPDIPAGPGSFVWTDEG